MKGRSVIRARRGNSKEGMNSSIRQGSALCPVCRSMQHDNAATGLEAFHMDITRGCTETLRQEGVLGARMSKADKSKADKSTATELSSPGVPVASVFCRRPQWAQLSPSWQRQRRRSSKPKPRQPEQRPPRQRQPQLLSQRQPLQRWLPPLLLWRLPALPQRQPRPTEWWWCPRIQRLRGAGSWPLLTPRSLEKSSG